MISRAGISAAYGRIKDQIRRTPVISVNDPALGGQTELWLKLESLQHTGSFKPRGVFNSIYGAAIPAAGVVAVSGGNHGAAVGYGAKRAGVASRVFVPSYVELVKVDRMKGFGAQVVVCGSIQNAFEQAASYCEQTGAVFIHPYDQLGTVEGQGTVGLEIEEQLPQIDTLLVAVGGGGLIGGIAAWYEGRIKIVGVETEGTATLASALKAGQPVTIKPSGLAAGALGASEIGQLSFDVASKWVDHVVVVSDDDLIEAQRRLWQSMRVIGEPGGVTALAALTSGLYQPEAGEKVGIIVCGGNADPGWFL